MTWDPTTKAARRTIEMARRGARLHPAALHVDGERLEGDSLDCAFRLSAGAIFTADADAARRVLPAPTLHPIRWTPGRTVVSVEAQDWQWRLGSMPPVRSLDLYVSVGCTLGTRPAPPVLPMLLESTSLGARYATGGYWLAWLTTNRVTREVFSRLLGVDAVLVDAREYRAPKRSRFTFTDHDHLILDLDVHLGHDARVNTLSADQLEGYRSYGVRDGQLLGWAVTCHDVGSAFRPGPGQATLGLGEHPVAHLVRGLGLSTRTFGAGVRVSGREVYDGPVHLGPATPAPATGTQLPDSTITRRAVLAETPGHEAPIAQLPHDLPFDPAGTFTLEPR